MSDYQSTTFRAVQLGLQIRDAADKVTEGYWTRLTNVRSTQEALLTTREGLELIDSNDPFGSFHSIRRLSTLVRVWGVGLRLHRDSLGTYVNPVTGFEFTGFSGNPLSLVPFQGTDSRVPWMFVGDTATLKKAGAAANNEFYQWGIDPPVVAVTAAPSGLGNLNSTVAGAIPYEWRYTYSSNTTGAESNPSPAMAFPLDVVNQSVTLAGAGSTDPQVDLIRWWRRGGTLTGPEYYLVTTGGNGAALADDNMADSAAVLQEQLSFDKYRPFQTTDLTGAQVQVNLPYLTSFAGKYILACGDSNRPGYLYWTNPGDPDSASVSNNVQITSQAEALTGVFVYDGQPFCWTKDNLYAVMFGQDIITFRGQVTSCGRGVAAPWAYTADGPQIFFLSQDGIYATDGQSPAVSLTESSLRPIFNGLSVGDFTPIDYTAQEELRMWYAAQELHFVYKDTAGEFRHLRWHSAYNRWRQSSYFPGAVNNAPTAVYEDEGQSSSVVYLGFSSGFLYKINTDELTDAGQPIEAHVRTGSFDFNQAQTLKGFGNIIIDADCQGGSITFTPYFNVDGEDQPGSPTVITGTGRQKYTFSLGDIYAYTIAADFAWGGQGILYQFEILWRTDEEKLKHWEQPSTSHGLSGWQQMRDLYLDMRLTADAVLVIQVDDTNYTYTVPETGGFRRKVYVQCYPAKGKVFRYVIDCPEIFSIYGEDCEVRLKPWNTDLGYALMSPFRPTNRETQ